MGGCSAFYVTLLVTSGQCVCVCVCLCVCVGKEETDSFRLTHTHTHSHIRMHCNEIRAERGYKSLSLISYFPVVRVKLTFSVPAIP